MDNWDNIVGRYQNQPTPLPPPSPHLHPTPCPGGKKNPVIPTSQNAFHRTLCLCVLLAPGLSERFYSTCFWLCNKPQAFRSYCSSFRYPKQVFWSFVPPSEIRAKQSGPIVPRSGIHSKRFGPLFLLLGFVPSILVLLFLVLGFVAYLLVPYRPFAPRSRIRFQSFTELQYVRFGISVPSLAFWF